MRSEHWFLGLALVMLTGCGGDKGKERTGGVQADPRCTAYTAATCGKMQQCWPWLLQASYGDLQTCESRSAALCANVLTAKGTSWTPDKIESCAKALPGISCDVWWNSVAPACDPGPGQLANGASCIDKSQCQGGTCLQGASAGCGQCASVSPVGGDCAASAECVPGAACSPEGKCVAPVGLGETCDASHPCSINLRCHEGKCASLVGLGETCDPAGFDCNFFQGLACDPSSKTCKSVKLASDGERCGLVDGDLTACRSGAVCSPEKTTCIPHIPDGAACGAQSESQCQPPATCIGGVCTVPGASCG